MTVIYVLMAILFYYFFLHDLFSSGRSKKNESAPIRLSTGTFVNPQTLSPFDLMNTNEYAFIKENLRKYPNYKEHRIGNEVRSDMRFMSKLIHGNQVNNGWVTSYEQSQFESKLESAFENLLSTYDKVVREYNLFKSYINKIETPKIEAAAKKRREEEITQKETETKRQKEEYLKTIQESQKKSLERLLFNRQSELISIQISNNEGGTYIIRNNINNNLYVGSTENLYKRINSHLTSLKSGKHHSFKLQEEFNQFGEKSFSFFIIKSIPFTELSEKGSIKSLQVEDKKKKYKLHLKSEESTLLKLLNPFYNIETDTRGSRHWKDNEKYSGYRDVG